VDAFKAVLRGFSYLFHLVLGLFLLAIAGLALATGPQARQLGMLPWSGATLSYVLFFGGLLCLVSIVLAFLGKSRLLFFAWTLVVAVLLLKGYFFSSYRFSPGGAQFAFELVAAAWIAVIGAAFILIYRARPRY